MSSRGRLEESGRLRRYRPWLEQSRSFRPHQLAEDMERLLLDRDVAGSSAWTRLFDETLAALRFPFRDRRLTMEEALDRLSDSDSDVRRAAASTLSTVLGENARLFAHILNTLLKDKEIDDRWRGFSRSVSARNLQNRVEDEVVDALVASVKRAYPDLSHRYYRLKAGWLGQERLAWWDRNAPLPEADTREFSWPEAKRIVLESYGAFSPRMAEVARRVLRQWLDRRPAAARQGHRGRSPIRPCRARIPMCCSTTRARPGMWRRSRTNSATACISRWRRHRAISSPRRR